MKMVCTGVKELDMAVQFETGELGVVLGELEDLESIDLIAGLGQIDEISSTGVAKAERVASKRCGTRPSSEASTPCPTSVSRSGSPISQAPVAACGPSA